METTEVPQHYYGGIHNHFKGATILKLIINGGGKNAQEMIGVNEEEKDEIPMRSDEQITPVVGRDKEEERFHFVHPEIEDEEAWRIHDAVKRLVTFQKVPEICAYLRVQEMKDRLLLPPNPIFVYEELKRLGMPTGVGYSEKYFAACYKK